MSNHPAAHVKLMYPRYLPANAMDCNGAEAMRDIVHADHQALSPAGSHSAADGVKQLQIQQQEQNGSQRQQQRSNHSEEEPHVGGARQPEGGSWSGHDPRGSPDPTPLPGPANGVAGRKLNEKEQRRRQRRLRAMLARGLVPPPEAARPSASTAITCALLALDPTCTLSVTGNIAIGAGPCGTAAACSNVALCGGVCSGC